MTNDELNRYIKHYIEKDKTGRAIMLTGAWGMGKSFYIKNSLIPFLEKPENGEHQCIVVSLYGLSDLADLSKAIYFEARVKKLNFESEAGKAVLLAGKTVLKGLAGHFGFNLDAGNTDLQALFNSIDLSGKLIIFEDVERTKINIIDFLGHVNSLVEQDNVKVLLVTNEAEIIKYKPIQKIEPSKEENAWSVVHSRDDEAERREYTDETVTYLQAKEKSIGDTITFEGDLRSAIKEIISSFDNDVLLGFATDQTVQDIVEMMILIGSKNLRSVIFACQKTADIYEFIPDSTSQTEDFLRSLFYSVAAFSMRSHAGAMPKWVGAENYSMELGIGNCPLFRFCYDYIVFQRINPSAINSAEATFNKMRLYDPNKSNSDPDIRILLDYYIYPEIEVKKAVENITQKLENPEEISFYFYGKLAMALVSVKYNLGIEIETAKQRLVNNLTGRGTVIQEDDLFWHHFSGESEEAQEELTQLMAAMVQALGDRDSISPEFDYSPEQIPALYDYAIAHTGDYYEAHGFAKQLDIPRFAELFFRCTAIQMNQLRATFNAIYRPSNIKEFLSDDLEAIDQLKHSLEASKEHADIDKVQQLQFKMFASVLADIRDKLL